MMQTGEGPLILSVSPTFTTYSSGRSFAQIAARVVEELGNQSDSDSDILHWNPEHEFVQQPHHHANGRTETMVSQSRDPEDNDDDFEFAAVPRDSQAVAEDLFYNGQIRPIYPLFDTNLLLNASIDEPEPKPKRVHRPSLGKLMSEDREASSCSSSSLSEADELDGVNPETYCVWTPKESLERCKKSKSMGSSKRWKLRDLLFRSHSDGNETFLFLALTSKRVEKIGDEKSAAKFKSNRVAAAAAAATDGC